MIYQIPVDQITGLAKYGLALSCTAVSDLAESDLARYAAPVEGVLSNGPPLVTLAAAGRWSVAAAGVGRRLVNH